MSGDIVCGGCGMPAGHLTGCPRAVAALRAEVATLKAEVAALKAERDGARHVRDLAIKDIGRMHGEIKALEASLASACAAAFEEAAKVADAEESRAYAQFSELPKSGSTFDRWSIRRLYAKELAASIRALAAKWQPTQHRSNR